MNILIVGGVFDEDGGRPSGFIDKFARFIGAQNLCNGGHVSDLKIATNLPRLTHVFWLADVPNTYPKLLPNLLEQNPRAILIQSKNNRKGLYSREQLFTRMRKSNAEYLIEFNERDDGTILSSILTIQGTVVRDKTDSIKDLAFDFIKEFARIGWLNFPVPDFNDAIPTKDHPGAFGVQRKMHIHEGVDLYAKEHDVVEAMEEGTVVYFAPFTGPKVDSPWWNETYCIMIEGASGVINYGEIFEHDHLKVGDKVQSGEFIGNIATVLQKDKGRPMSMLHIERYTTGTRAPLKEWSNGMEQPENLLNPTTLLFKARRVSK